MSSLAALKARFSGWFVWTGDDREFLPAALEILETPASPVGRAVALTLMAFACIAFVWTLLGKVDITATAQGRVVNAGHAKLIQPLETGLVKTIRVQDGDRVHAGDVLIDLDTTDASADAERLTADLGKTRLDVARLRVLRENIVTAKPLVKLVPPPGAHPMDVERANAVTKAQAAEHGAKIENLRHQIQQRQAEAAEVDAMIAKVSAGLPIVRQQVEALQRAVEMEVGSKLQFLEANQRLVDQQNELLVQKERAGEVRAARIALEQQIVEAEAHYQREVLSELAESSQKSTELEQDLIKARSKVGRQELRAPVDGVVQQLAVHTVGAVVTPAQGLMIVVPEFGALEVEVLIPNRDVGFVHSGDVVQIKVDAFNFTRYGLLKGRVTSISADSIPRSSTVDTGSSERDRVTNRSGSEPPGEELLYWARIQLDRAAIQIDDHKVLLSPGMAVTAEIRTGERRIISYLLDPLVRHQSESLHER
jgi:hemolysin D